METHCAINSEIKKRISGMTSIQGDCHKNFTPHWNTLAFLKVSKVMVVLNLGLKKPKEMASNKLGARS